MKTGDRKDKERDECFKKQGFRILRFWDNEVLKNPEGVLEVIRQNCLDHPHPNLPPSEGEGIGCS